MSKIEPGHNPKPVDDAASVASLTARLDAQDAEIARLKSQPAAPAAPAVSAVDNEDAARERKAAQAEAAKKPHPQKHGSLVHKQILRDGTEVKGREVLKDGATEYTSVPITYSQTPEGNIIDGGPYGGKFL